MTRAALDYVLWDMGQAFDMLFANLKDLRDEDWGWVPDGAVRSIRAIVGHVASCKVMYDNHAFGDASMTWMDPRFGEAQSPAEGSEFSPQTLVDWLRESHLTLVKSVDALDEDGELLKERRVNWGGLCYRSGRFAPFSFHGLLHCHNVRRGIDALLGITSLRRIFARQSRTRRCRFDGN